jgi:ubiquinone/menaquinone biosynthesis C-methylase UbiE
MSHSNTLYNSIGSEYNSTRQADPYIAEKLFQFLSPKTNELYLDIGCGTGNYTIALANKGFSFYGVEPSGKMLDIAKSRNQVINWLIGQAEQILTDDNIFDGCIATLTIHHWADIEKAFKELYRVLKGDGKIVFFTSTPEQMQRYWLNYYFPKTLKDAIKQMPSFETIKNAAANAGFAIKATEKYFIKNDLRDCFLYVGKDKPELYFDEKIRKGISSFSTLSNSDEVKKGLSLLCEDIKNGRFKEIQSKYNNYSGDYLFIVAEKKNK